MHFADAVQPVVYSGEPTVEGVVAFVEEKSGATAQSD